jgi:hypothetical protein
LWGITLFSFIKFNFNFSKKPEEDAIGQEGYHRLLSIFSKNKYGYHTRFMSDFELFLEAMLNEKFIDDSTLYYDDAFTSKEIEDMELGLNGDFARADVRHLIKDKDAGHHESFKSLRFPDRVGTNYTRSDDLSCYKILPKGQMPSV